jgi:hypothetical protein
MSECLEQDVVPANVRKVISVKKKSSHMPQFIQINQKAYQFFENIM